MNTKMMLTLLVLLLALQWTCAWGESPSTGPGKRAERCCSEVLVPPSPQGMSIERAEQYRLRALAGDSRAQYEYALLLMEGSVVRKDAADAVQWLQRAARRGSTRAARLLEQLAVAGCRYPLPPAAGAQAPAAPDPDVAAYQRQVEQGLLPAPSFGGRLPMEQPGQ